MKHILISLIPLMALLVGGCANIEKYQSLYQNSEITDDAIGAMRFLDPPIKNRPKFDLGADQRTFDFGSGKAFYLAFDIPNTSDYPYVYLRCLLSTSAAISSHVALITANFYGPSFELIESIEPEYTSHQTMGFDGAYYDATIEVPPHASYMVVYADPENFGNEIPYAYTGVIVGGGIVTSSNSTFMIPLGPGGPIRIQFLPKAQN